MPAIVSNASGNSYLTLRGIVPDINTMFSDTLPSGAIEILAY